LIIVAHWWFIVGILFSTHWPRSFG